MERCSSSEFSESATEREIEQWLMELGPMPDLLHFACKSNAVNMTKDMEIALSSRKREGLSPVIDAFVTLTIVDDDDMTKNFENATFSSRADLDEISHVASAEDEAVASNPSIGLDELFNSIQSGDTEIEVSSAMALGAAGTGKTTAMAMLAYMISLGRMYRGRFALTLLYQLRDPKVQEVKNLRDLLAIKLACLEIVKEAEVDQVFDHYRKHPHRLCLIFDGLDECPLSECSNYLQGLLKRDFLPRAYVITTSRPCEDAHTLAKTGRYKRIVDVIGFSEDNVKEFVKKALGHKMAEDMMKELAKNKTMAGLMRTPLFSAIACQLYKDKKPLPKCATGMFETLATRILERDGDRTYADLSKVPFHKYDVLLEVGRFALLMLKMGKVVFTEDDLEKMVLSSAARRLGMILSSKMTGGDITFQFSHLSLQEYVAAVYVARCIETKGIDVTEAVVLLKEPRGRLTMFWRFLVGILPTRSATILLRDLWKAMLEPCK